MREIGRAYHWLLESFFVSQMQKKNLSAFFEIYPNKKTLNKKLYQKYSKYHCDSTILNLEDQNDNLKNLSKWIKKLPKSIKMINIDYFLGISEKRITKKCLKGYQGKHKLLILLSIHGTKNNIPQVPYFIPYRKNVIIVDPYKFAKIFGFNGETYDKFINFIQLIKGATYSKDKTLRLLRISKKAKDYLLNNPQFSQAGLEKYLNSNKILRMDLLEYLP